MGTTLHKECKKLYCFCFICDEDLTNGYLGAVKKKEIRTLINCSERRWDGKGVDLAGLPYVTVHEKCRKLYTNEKSIKSALNRSQELNLNENDQQPTGDREFKFREKCIFCEENITEQFLLNESKKSHSKRNKVFKIRNPGTKNGITKAANQHNDGSYVIK